MKIATWNVNSVRARLPHLLEWLRGVAPDVLLLQETKTRDEKFPFAEIEAAGYECAHYGQSAYNGVAVLSKTPLGDIARGMSGGGDDEQARLIAATAGGVRVVSAYVPNGQNLQSEKYEYKLRWLADFAVYLRALAGAPAVIGGDYNIAPADADIYDADDWGESILASPPERAALKTLLDAGFADAHRLFDQPEKSFTWWDYRQMSFRRNRGLRIDLILVSAAMQARCTACAADLRPRAWERPSDHAPVVAEFK